MEAKKKDLINEGIAYHRQALKGDKGAAQKAHDFFEQAQREYPGDHRIMAYYGDSLSLLAKGQDQPSQMFANAITAMKYLDTSVTGSPNNLEIRRLRAEHSMRLPEPFFRRTATAVTDYEYLVQEYEKDKNRIAREEHWEHLYQLGCAYQRLGMEKEAASTWKKLLSQNSDGQYRKRVAQHQLGDLGQIKRLHSALSRRGDILKEGIRLHNLGVQGNRQGAQLAFNLLKKAHEMKPDDPIALAYYGSAMTLKGRDANEAQDIFTNVFNGLKLLKQAVSKDMNNPRIRLLRGYVQFHLPENFFHMTEKAIKDLRFAKLAYEQDNKVFSPETYNQLVRDLAEAYRRIDDQEKAEKLLKNQPVKTR